MPRNPSVLDIGKTGGCCAAASQVSCSQTLLQHLECPEICVIDRKSKPLQSMAKINPPDFKTCITRRYTIASCRLRKISREVAEYLIKLESWSLLDVKEEK